MRILFLTVDVEYEMRGIGAIMKNLIKAARADGHEVGLLTGIPYEHAYEGSLELRDRVEHVHLQHYLIEGKKSFRGIMPGGYRKRNIIKAMLTGLFLKHSFMAVRKELLSGRKNLAHDLDFIIRSPFIYRFMVHNVRLSRYLIKRICQAYNIDLVLAVSPTRLRSRDIGSQTKLATFIHDIMPVEIIETPVEGDTPVRFASEIETAIKHSDLLLANSKDTAKKISDLFPETKASVVYGVASSAPSEITESAILEMKDLKKDSYLLFASMVEKRKNVEGLIDAYMIAFEQLKDLPLVIVGAPGYGFEQLKVKYKALPAHIRKNIIFTGFISEDDKFTLFKNARAFVFPSFYEGIGVIVIEAVSYGLPVLTSRRGALPEAAGDAALYIENPYDVHEIAEGLVKISFDEKLRKNLSAASKDVAHNFTFELFKERVANALKTIE